MWSSIPNLYLEPQNGHIIVITAIILIAIIILIITIIMNKDVKHAAQTMQLVL